MHIKKAISIIAVTLFCGTIANTLWAGSIPIFYGPTPYTSEADIPAGFYSEDPYVLENFETARKRFEKIGMKTDIVQIQVNRSKNMTKGKRFEAQNPVWIISGQQEKP